MINVLLVVPRGAESLEWWTTLPAVPRIGEDVECPDAFRRRVDDVTWHTFDTPGRSPFATVELEPGKAQGSEPHDGLRQMLGTLGCDAYAKVHPDSGVALHGAEVQDSRLLGPCWVMIPHLQYSHYMPASVSIHIDALIRMARD